VNIKSELVKVINFNRLFNPVAITLCRNNLIQRGLCFLVPASRLLCLVVGCTHNMMWLVMKLFKVCVQRLLADQWQHWTSPGVLPTLPTQIQNFVRDISSGYQQDEKQSKTAKMQWWQISAGALYVTNYTGQKASIITNSRSIQHRLHKSFFVE